MPKFHGYTNAGNGIERISSESRTRERVAEVNRDVIDIRSDILSLKIMIQAMMEILAERGVDPEAVNARIEEIMARPETFAHEEKESKPCPRCGRLILDNGVTPLTGTCLYCGKEVKFTPRFKVGNEPEQAEEEWGIPVKTEQ